MPSKNLQHVLGKAPGIAKYCVLGYLLNLTISITAAFVAFTVYSRSREYGDPNGDIANNVSSLLLLCDFSYLFLICVVLYGLAGFFLFYSLHKTTFGMPAKAQGMPD